MSESPETLLQEYLQLPGRLEAAIAGLSEEQLDLTLGMGWSIRVYVHHTVEGELLWQMCLRSILGTDGIEFPIQWYFSISQDDWAQHWAYGKRPIEPALAQYRGSTASLVELLRCLPAQAWEHYGHVTWPGEKEESRLTVRDIAAMHIGHLGQHSADIRAIRELHHCQAI
jgi:hypothetical protein